MIRSLRRRHWRTFWILAVVLPVLFVLALLARQSPPAPNPPMVEQSEMARE